MDGISYLREDMVLYTGCPTFMYHILIRNKNITLHQSHVFFLALARAFFAILVKTFNITLCHGSSEYGPDNSNRAILLGNQVDHFNTTKFARRVWSVMGSL